MVKAMSSAVACISIIKTACAINSDACTEKICTPNTRSVSASVMIFINPSVSAIARARPLAAKGKLPSLIFKPAVLHSSSVLPTQAISGCVYITEGIKS